MHVFCACDRIYIIASKALGRYNLDLLRVLHPWPAVYKRIWVRMRNKGVCKDGGEWEEEVQVSRCAELCIKASV